MEILFELPVDGKAIVESTAEVWRDVCRDFLGFTVPMDNTLVLQGQRILIKRLLEQVAIPLPPNAEKDQVQLLVDLRNPQRYSWGSACLAWLYRELCKASDKMASQIGGSLLLVQYWAWAKFPFLYPRVERGPLIDAYSPPVSGPLSMKKVVDIDLLALDCRKLWVPSKKNRPSNVFLLRYREQIASMQPN
ncbi:serine/threonine-protein phosphatase 7 long form homolog [Quercus robur]|uniref:serine/threonine-protein phosphatase 7 long form homolog n=1 Tax=Quercus robur TaxID=38942 RepID=UPI0021624438|nr:serine/threonine-protein phosphatase 7 long form homolog [Quercus robur]